MFIFRRIFKNKYGFLKSILYYYVLDSISSNNLIFKYIYEQNTNFSTMNENVKQSNALYVFINDVNREVTEKTEKNVCTDPTGTNR